MRRFIALAMVLSLSGCAASQSEPAEPSVLQRYDGLSAQLKAVTVLTGRLSVDLSDLGSLIDRDRARSARTAAVRLKRDALLEENATGQVGWRVRDLIAPTRNWRIRTYFGLVAHALSWEWAEAESLRRLSNLVWWDPLFLSQPDARLLGRLDTRARREASQASGLVLRARNWKLKYARSFRYVPVPIIPTN